jgi:SAM-dependent MidA family methyltransferase
VTPLAALLAERIRRFGAITFAEYMRECLYHPVHGYYNKPESGRFADYYTSVDVHPIFGRLLARQFAEMWQQMDSPEEFLIVEAAAGTGRLANHILEFTEAFLPEFHRVLRYIAVERSPARCDQLAAHLSSYAGKGKCQTSIEFPPDIPAGCVFSNEFLDALPVHRVLQQEGKLKELYVTRDGDGFTDISMPLSSGAISEYFAALGVQAGSACNPGPSESFHASIHPGTIALQENQLAEAGLEVCDWITEIARRLHRGFLLSIDYGHEAAELFDSHHMTGTVLAYARHQASGNLYAAPGEQDLTAHVNFSAVRLWGQRSALETLGRVSQTAFLLALGQANEFADLYDRGMDETEHTRARLQLKTLIYPEGMGERFHVLVQHKGVPHAKLTALSGL